MNEEIWVLEVERLNEVKKKIKEEVEKLGKVVEHRQEEALQIRRSFWDEVTVNTSDYTEIAETAASIRQQQAILSEQERDYEHADRNLKKLIKMEKSPYFARIDFNENGSASEEIYIGLGSLVDNETHEILIYDWRAPISGLFYDFTPGPARYETPIGVIEGELTLKRQFIIKQGKLENVFDTGIQIGDEMLQAMLAKNANEKMSHIVTSIQQEQNEIIRDERHDILIVQGAAGSGKTSAALQRVAYLLYRYRNSLNSDNMVLFSPNSIFNDYVSNVLPELGETNMLQTTFQEHIEQQIEKTVDVEDGYDQLEYLLLGSDTDSAYKTRVKGIKWKTSRSFMRLMDDYIVSLKKEGMLFHPYILRNKILISSERLHHLFYRELADVESISARIEKMKNWIQSELAKFERRVQKRFYRKLVEHPRYMGTEAEMKKESEQRAKKWFSPLKRQTRTFQFLDVMGMYRALFDERMIPKEQADVGLYTINQLKRQRLPYEDATPYIYLKQMILGMETINRIKHVIIDEAQDYSPFQLEYVRKLFPRAKFTILGDLNQGIFYANEQSYQKIEELFDDQRIGVRRLTKSYRSTAEIVAFTRNILRHNEAIEPVGRHGAVPEVTEARQNDLSIKIAERIRSMLENGLESIAVICRSAKESIEACERLRESLAEPPYLIEKDTLEFKKGVTIVPAYLAKGLEFDGVIIYDAGEHVYNRDEERKLLYTACTRALHELRIFYTGRLSPLLPDVSIDPTSSL